MCAAPSEAAQAAPKEIDEKAINEHRMENLPQILYAFHRFSLRDRSESTAKHYLNCVKKSFEEDAVSPESMATAEYVAEIKRRHSKNSGFQSAVSTFKTFWESKPKKWPAIPRNAKAARYQVTVPAVPQLSAVLASSSPQGQAAVAALASPQVLAASAPLLRSPHMDESCHQQKPVPESVLSATSSTEAALDSDAHDATSSTCSKPARSPVFSSGAESDVLEPPAKRPRSDGADVIVSNNTTEAPPSLCARLILQRPSRRRLQAGTSASTSESEVRSAAPPAGESLGTDVQVKPQEDERQAYSADQRLMDTIEEFPSCGEIANEIVELCSELGVSGPSARPRPLSQEDGSAQTGHLSFAWLQGRWVHSHPMVGVVTVKGPNVRLSGTDEQHHVIQDEDSLLWMADWYACPEESTKDKIVWKHAGVGAVSISCHWEKLTAEGEAELAQAMVDDRRTVPGISLLSLTDLPGMAWEAEVDGEIIQRLAVGTEGPEQAVFAGCHAHR